ncbi:alkaline phosphatase family protein [Nannocystis pusilla]|uniref:alkaline phosphatase family protein n=1 Tax=Nannocystis pusilla TaxID=889268 RepID=UPI003B7C31CE
MTVRQCLVLLLACCALGLGVPLLLGVTYSARLSSHDTGFFAVQVDDAIAADAQPRRPRRSVLVVIDGLGHEAAKTMGAIALLREHGQCRKTAVGVPSMSRPVYATISTGLEQDRTGARGNDDETPLFAQSIWQRARAAGMSVAVVSELTWWEELFPGAFTHYDVLPLDADYFAALPPADLQLVHPLYVDEVGHEFGAASPEYAEAVGRADRELTGLLRTLDFAQDLVVLTADHGHSARGGHGGAQEPIANVMTCHAGLGVRRDPEYGHLRITTVAPSLALLLGLPFPAHMRAGDDDLDALFAIADPAAFSPEYLADRRAAVERFRRANEDAVRAWLPDSAGSWDAFTRSGASATAAARGSWSPRWRWCSCCSSSSTAGASSRARPAARPCSASASSRCSGPSPTPCRSACAAASTSARSPAAPTSSASPSPWASAGPPSRSSSTGWCAAIAAP